MIKITLIKIGCKVWNGCGINPEEIFLKIIKEKYQKYSGGKLPQLTIPQTVESRALCMIGFMGEKKSVLWKAIGKSECIDISSITNLDSKKVNTTRILQNYIFSSYC